MQQPLNFRLAAWAGLGLPATAADCFADAFAADEWPRRDRPTPACRLA